MREISKITQFLSRTYKTKLFHAEEPEKDNCRKSSKPLKSFFLHIKHHPVVLPPLGSSCPSGKHIRLRINDHTSLCRYNVFTKTVRKLVMDNCHKKHFGPQIEPPFQTLVYFCQVPSRFGVVDAKHGFPDGNKCVLQYP